MASRNDFDDFFGDDNEPSPVIDTRADGRLYRVPLSRLAANLVNPRTDFGTEDQLMDLGKSLARRQNQPCPVVSRSAYLKLWPDHGSRVGDVDYVLVSGERRYRAATLTGLPALDCVANDDFAVDRRTFMEAVVSENVDRQNFDPVEEAYAVQALVFEFGTNRAVAQHFERADGWVTQRILLTHLAPAVQDLVRTKALPLEHARTLGKLARDNKWGEQQQLMWWLEERDRRDAVKAARKASKTSSPSVETTDAPAASFTAVKQPTPVPVPESASPAPALPVTPPVVDRTVGPAPLERSAPTPATTVAETAVPEPRQQPKPVSAVTAPEAQEQGADDQPAPKRLPYNDGPYIGRHLIKKQEIGEMPADEFRAMMRLLKSHEDTLDAAAS